MPVRSFLISLLPVIVAAVVGASVAGVIVHAQDAAAPATATPLGNGFTYQGRLAQNNSSATGPFDFQFYLFDAEGVTAAQVGTAIQVDDLQVNAGLFAVTLDFGANAFNGAQRWLEVRVRPGAGTGPGGFEILGRQQLTATPYALYAKATDWAGITNIPGGFADGVDNVGTPYSAGSGIAVSGSQISVLFAGDGEASTVARSDHDHFGDVFSGNNALGLEVFNSDTGGVGLKVSGGSIGISANTLTSSGTAVRANAESGTGVDAVSQTGIGLFGRTSGQFAGVVGANLNAGACDVLAPCAGVAGVGTGVGTGVLGVGDPAGNGVGVVGTGLTGVRAQGREDGLVAVGGIRRDGTESNAKGNGVQATGLGKGIDGAGVVGMSSVHPFTDGGGCLNTGGFIATEWCVGVYGIGTGSASIGTYGQGGKFGVYGTVVDPLQSAGAGVVGDKGAGEWAGRFFGPVQVNGTTPSSTAMTISGNVTVSGSISCPGCVPPLSDARAKLGIVNLPAGLNEVLKLRPVQFKWNPDVIDVDSATHSGLIAQEVREVLPANVYETADGYFGVNYPELIPVLIRAIQDLQAEVADLRANR
ncbi:hypothetical protein AYO38_09620 [bacterium SCGC AG-212-C10]|nr:hypothetical protein AYO38_09620 [bacterium SCGC AG-212-C10]